MGLGGEVARWPTSWDGAEGGGEIRLQRVRMIQKVLDNSTPPMAMKR